MSPNPRRMNWLSRLERLFRDHPGESCTLYPVNQISHKAFLNLARAMGTSSARQAPRSDQWRSVVNDLGKGVKEAAPFVDSSLKTILPLLPDGHTKAPLYWAASEGVHFCYDVYNVGLDQALKNEGVRLTKTFVAPQISDALWAKIVAKKPGLTNSPVGKITEKAFKDTMNDIITMGVEAGEGFL